MTNNAKKLLKRVLESEIYDSNLYGDIEDYLNEKNHFWIIAMQPCGSFTPILVEKENEKVKEIDKYYDQNEYFDYNYFENRDDCRKVCIELEKVFETIVKKTTCLLDKNN